MSMPAAKVRAALKHLRSADPIMKQVISDVGPFTLELQRNRFHVLVRSIISQQISTSAARTIRQRLEDLVAPAKVAPESLVKLTAAQLRGAGLSQQKASYLRDLTDKSNAGQLRLNQIGRLSDDQVIEELVQVKGIGRWTAQMFMMFCLGRLDVFPHDDLGIRNALRKMYGLSDLPDKETCHEIAKPWRPYATIASWYCWRSLDRQKNGKGCR